MDGDSTGSLALIGLLLLFSAFFSASETAFSSLNRIRIKNMAENGDDRAALVLALYENYDKLLSSILVGNNIVNIALTSIVTVLFVRRFGDGGATLSTIATTVAVLIFGEVSPKTIAKESPERVALFAAPLLRLLLLVAAPVNFLFAQWRKVLSLLFRAPEEQAITEEELFSIIQEAEEEGAIDEEDRTLIQSVMDFNDSKAADILTPRVDVVAVEREATLEEIGESFLHTGYSRIPVYEESIDNIVGVLHIRDFFELTVKHKKLEDIIGRVIFVPPNAKISDLLKTLQAQKCHLAVVTDEFGGTVGIVTMEDILEELVGEIWDEHDEIIQQFVKLESGDYRISCSADIDEMLRFFHLTGEADSSTVSGWVIEQLGRIPKEGDTFSYENLFVTVTRLDNRRVMEITVHVTDAGEGGGARDA